MIDTVLPAAQSEFTATSSQFDASALDRNLQTISAVERTWRSPALPDEVKLDLAMMPGIQPQGLTSFLQQVDSDGQDDFGEIEEDEPEAPAPSPRPQRSGTDLARVIFADVANEPAPTEPNVDAVEEFKRRAIDRGFLEPDTPIDNIWSPELNSVRYEMMFDDYDQSQRGNRYGAVDARTFVDVLADWTQPTSLLAAATELDLFWDFGAVRNEFSSWGDKFRKIGEADNPWEWGGNLIDAITGPIDDMVMPIVNWGLIASGVGGVYATARLGAMGAKAAQTGGMLGRIYKGGGVARNLGFIAQPSWTAQKLVQSSRAPVAAAGRGLASWRAKPVVQGTKVVSQAGMRLGFASQAQDLLPGYQGGLDLAGDPEDPTMIGRAAQGLREFGQNPATIPLELALAPYNIFSPGTFIGKQGTLSRTASGLYKVSGTAGGRAAIGGLGGAAVGSMLGDDLEDMGTGALLGALGFAAMPAVGVLGQNAAQVLENTTYAKGLGKKIGKFVGHPSDFLASFSFKPVAENQRTATAFDRAFRRALEASDPDALELFDEGWRQRGTLSGAVGFMEGVDDETGAAIVTWRMLTASIDQKAAEMASNVGSGSWDARFFDFRNSYIGQLRQFDLDFDDISDWKVEELVRSAVLTKFSGENPQKYNRQVQLLLDRVKDDPAAILELANTHNQNAQRMLTELMTEGITEDALYNHLDKTVLHGRWTPFVEADADIADLMRSGLLDQAEFKSWMSPDGNAKKFRAGTPPTSSSTRMIREGMDDAVFSTLDSPRTVTNKNLATMVDEAPSGRLTPARFDTPTAQEVTEQAQKLTRLRGVAEGLKSANAHGVNWRAVESAAGAPLTELDANQLKVALRAATGSSKYSGTAEVVAKMAKQHDLDFHQMVAAVDGQIQDVLDDVDTWSRFGLEGIVRGESDEVLSGLPALKRRIKELNHKAHYTAAEVDVDGLAAKLRDAGDEAGAQRVLDFAEGLKGREYKLVYGKEFMAPHDLLQGFKPFEDITTRHLNSATMGNFFRRRLPAERRMLEDTRHRAVIAKTLGRATGRDIKAQDQAVTDVLSDLRKVLDNIHADSSPSMDKLWQENWWRRRLATGTSFTPLRIEDLSSRKVQVIEALVGLGHDRPVANAIWENVGQLRSSEFSDVGLYAIEAYLRKNNQFAQALKFVGGHKGTGLISGRNAHMAVGGFAGYHAGAEFGPESEDGNLGARVLGAVAGATAGAGTAALGRQITTGTGAIAQATRVAKRGADFVDGAPAPASLLRRVETNRAGYLADHLARTRDTLRFTLSPYFDISRYTEGMMLGQAAAPLRGPDGERLALHLNMSPRGLRKRYIKENLKGLHPDAARAKSHEWFADELAKFQAAAKGDFDPQVLDPAGKWFSQVGIMGFSPTDWMTSAFVELRQVGGLDPETAYKAVREMYTYGTAGRSAAEMSVNFILFPFSFQKKALTHVSKWMNDDLARSIMIHDALKTYEILDEKHNLNDYWRDHLPVLEQLQRLNLFAFGISGGQLGGINRRLVEPFVAGATNYAQNMFTPQGASLKESVDAAQFQDIWQKAMPVLNDINWMTEEIRQQTNVFTSESGVTIDAEIRQGYEEWNAYRDEVSEQLERNGYTWGDLRNKPWLADQWARYEATRAELGRKYPAWFDSRTRSTGNRIALEMEKGDHVARAAEGVGTAEDVMVYETEGLLARINQEAQMRGMDFGGGDGWEDAPPRVVDYIRRYAVQRLEADRRFHGVWQKFYLKEFGPLEAQI